jgi:penicillin-binding protein 2
LAKVARQFGLGTRTGIDLPVDGKGLIPDPDWRRELNKHNPDLAHWYPGNTLNMSIGQGDVLATPLQMAMVTAAVANGGTLWTPRIVRSAGSGADKVVTKPKGHSVGIDAANLELVREGMRRVVTKGTGRSVELPQVAIAGKTGSAEDANHTLPHAWFVCFAPYENPRIAIAVVVENAGHGAENAAPIAKKILETAFPAKPRPTGEASVRVASRH